ncbi:MAG: DUF4928 family protein [Chloroflexi bacterium]|nr:DUF4928 family protein [Chloroflexota bacterium]MCL5274255.1 DUF4928 family protein [Chloroflexota bacterium]
MGDKMLEKIMLDSRQTVNEWLASCTRGGKVSRNSLAIGIVVLDHLRDACPVMRDDVVSKGGEVKGTRSRLGQVLAKYEIPESFLKEVTTRQAHQDGQRLFERFDWGKRLAELPSDKRSLVLTDCIGILVERAKGWLERQNLKLQLDRRQAPSSWVSMIVENAEHRSGGVVEQHLVGAKLERRFKHLEINNYAAHAGDQQTERHGDFEIADLVYHVTATPSRNVIEKCGANIKAGRHPVLLAPDKEINKARILAQEESIESEMTIVSIEDFVALNIIEMAIEEKKDFYSLLKEIIGIYNKRLSEVETDLSLQISIK